MAGDSSKGNESTATSVPTHQTWFSRWRDFLSAPQDGSSLALFRIWFGLCMLANTWMYNVDVHLDYLKPKLFFSFIPGMTLWPGSGIYVHFGVMAVAAACIMLGIWYRAAAFVFFVCHTYLFLLEKAYYQNHFYLICLLSGLLIFLPAHRTWSLDNSEKTMPEWVPRWPVLLLKVQLAIVYFYGGIAKLNTDWLHGQPQTEYLHQHANQAIIGPIISQPWFAHLVTFGGITVDLLIGFLLFWQPTFWLGALIALSFHLMNSQLFPIGIFPWLMIGTIGLFAPYNWPRLVLAKLAAIIPPLKQRLRPLYEPDSEIPTEPPTKLNTLAMILLHAYVIVQIVVPLRRFLYPGETSWTEQGHRFSWSMMLRTKLIDSFQVDVIDPRTNKRLDADLTSYLNDKQIYYMMTRPDMILQYAHYIADQWEKKLGVRPQVHIRAFETLNLRPSQDLIDPTVDLAAEKDNLMPFKWIVPLKPRP